MVVSSSKVETSSFVDLLFIGCHGKFPFGLSRVQEKFLLGKLLQGDAPARSPKGHILQPEKFWVEMERNLVIEIGLISSMPKMPTRKSLLYVD